MIHSFLSFTRSVTTPAPSAKRDSSRRARVRAFLALLLLIPAPAAGTWFGLYSEKWRGTGTGQIVYAVSKIWILALPLLWRLFVDRKPLSWSPMRNGGVAAGLITGLLISAVILAGWFLAGRHWIDPGMMRATAEAAGIGNLLNYLLLAVYLCTVNAVLEEYVWRWFVFRKSEDLLARAGVGAILLSAMLFTVHHVLALLAQFPWLPAILASAGVFVGGCTWSALYLRYRSIWPGFISHVIVDITILAIGAWILFQPAG